MKLWRNLFLGCCLLPMVALAKPDQSGGMEGGGGNSYQGKPLESYIQDVTLTPAYIQKIKPLLLPAQHQDGAALRLFEVSLRKSWFFIPGALTGIPSKTIGAAIPTDQVALQSFKEVWIDAPLFNRMSLDDQAKLILHEMLMGIRLLKYNSNYELCLAYAYYPTYCESRDRRAGKATDLTTNDYGDIRAAVRELWDMQYRDQASWHDLLARHNFSMPSYVFKLKSMRTEISGEEILSSLRTAIATQSLPRHGYSEELLIQAEDEQREVVNTDGKCRFSMVVSADKSAFTLIGKNASENYLFAINKRQTYGQSAFWLNDRVVYSVYISDRNLSVSGEISNDLILIFDTYNKLIGFIPSKSILIEESNDKERRSSQIEIHGSQMMCLNQPSVISAW